MKPASLLFWVFWIRSLNSDDDHYIISLEGKSLRLAMDLIDYHDRLYHLQFAVFRPQVSLRSHWFTEWWTSTASAWTEFISRLTQWKQTVNWIMVEVTFPSLEKCWCTLASVLRLRWKWTDLSYPTLFFITGFKANNFIYFFAYHILRLNSCLTDH